MKGMQPEDVFELTGVSDPRVSPDGRTVAYVVWRIDKETNSYPSAIWTRGLANGSGEPRRLTSSGKRDVEPRWSPDGGRLAFGSDRDDRKKAVQLFVLPVDGGEAVKLTDRDEDVSQAAWSPDGSRLVFASRVRDAAYDEQDDGKRKPRRFTRLRYKYDNIGWTGDRPQHLFVVAANGSGDEPRQLTHGEFEDNFPCWSPDGRRIAFTSARHEDWDISLVEDLYVVDADGSGEPELLTSSDGACFMPSWSPDGRRIAFALYPAVMDDPKHWQIAVIDVASRERRILTESLDLTCLPYPPLREPIWDGDDLLFAVEDGGNTHLYRVPADGSSEPTLAVGGELIVTGYDAAGVSVVHTATRPTVLSELFAGDTRLTDVGDSFARGRELIEPERFTAVSDDGSEVDAWILKPAGFTEGERYPTILTIHGGPFTQYGNRFFDEVQVYAGAGYAVVYSNPRGSSGYSEAWGRAIRGPVDGGPGWGSVDYQDLMAVMDEAVKRFDFIDPDRLAVMGGSYGGYMTSWIVGHTDRFRTAISERAVNQWVSMWGSSDIGWDFKGQIGDFLFENLDAYVKMSPHTYATDIHTPLLILHSENDLRCPIEQGEQLFTTLRLLKRQVEFVRFPAESHELTRSGHPVHRVMRFEVVLDWFERTLRDGDSA